MAQSADSWILQRHREPPDVAAGEFRLSVEFGSRQWGGRRWAVDWSLGAFDDETAEHQGDIAWTISPLSDAPASNRTSSNGAGERILQVLSDHDEFVLTTTQLRKAVAGDTKAFERAFQSLKEQRLIGVEKRSAAEGAAGVLKARDRVGLTPTGPVIRRGGSNQPVLGSTG